MVFRETISMFGKEKAIPFTTLLLSLNFSKTLLINFLSGSELNHTGFCCSSYLLSNLVGRVLMVSIKTFSVSLFGFLWAFSDPDILFCSVFITWSNIKWRGSTKHHYLFGCFWVTLFGSNIPAIITALR